MHCFGCAASDENGTAIIYDTPTEHIYTGTVNKNILAPEVEVIPTEIKITRLDTFIERMNIEKIDLIKLDVETHETEVLEGFGEYLDKFKPTLFNRDSKRWCRSASREISRREGLFIF